MDNPINYWYQKYLAEKMKNEYMVEALRTEYEKGRADAIAETQREWSEEDENGLGDALWCCKQAASIAKDENDMGNVWYAEHWLKSIKPQNHWTPSDEQMKTLELIINSHSLDAYHLGMVQHLYNGLKTLKE